MAVKSFLFLFPLIFSVVGAKNERYYVLDGQLNQCSAVSKEGLNDLSIYQNCYCSSSSPPGITSTTTTQPPSSPETVPPQATTKQPPNPPETGPPQATTKQPPNPPETGPPQATTKQPPNPPETGPPQATTKQPPNPPETGPPQATTKQPPNPPETGPPQSTTKQPPNPPTSSSSSPSTTSISTTTMTPSTSSATRSEHTTTTTSSTTIKPTAEPTTFTTSSSSTTEDPTTFMRTSSAATTTYVDPSTFIPSEGSSTSITIEEPISSTSSSTFATSDEPTSMAPSEEPTTTTSDEPTSMMTTEEPTTTTPSATTELESNRCGRVRRSVCLDGDPHYRTFDGSHFDYSGTCPVIFSRPCGENPEFPFYQLKVKNFVNKHNSTVIESLQLEIYGTSIYVDIYHRLFIDGVKADLPHIVYDYYGGTLVEVNELDQMIILSAADSVGVSLNTDTFTMCLDIPDCSAYWGSTTLCGISGNYDGWCGNDIVFANGSLVEMSSSFKCAYGQEVSQWANSYITEEYFDPDDFDVLEQQPSLMQPFYFNISSCSVGSDNGNVSDWFGLTKKTKLSAATSLAPHFAVIGTRTTSTTTTTSESQKSSTTSKNLPTSTTTAPSIPPSTLTTTTTQQAIIKTQSFGYNLTVVPTTMAIGGFN